MTLAPTGRLAPRGVRSGACQRLVRRTMIQAGGYWRPLAAVARLLEELGELLELLGSGGPRTGTPAEIASELADLWIITAALADQFLADVADPETGGKPRRARHDREPGGPEWTPSEPSDPEPGLREPSDPEPSVPDPGGRELVVAAGEIARVVNHYDGPKGPREGLPLPSLGAVVGAFHERLSSLADALEIDLRRAVEEKIEQIHGRGDMTRFARGGFDPSTAGCLTRYLESLGEPPEGSQEEPARALRMWGAPDWRPIAVAANAAQIAPWLHSFAKAAVAEDLRGFVIAAPALEGEAARERWRGELLGSLAALGSAIISHPDHPTDDTPPAEQMRFGGLRMGAQMSAVSGDAGETFLLLIPGG